MTDIQGHPQRKKGNFLPHDQRKMSCAANNRRHNSYFNTIQKREKKEKKRDNGHMNSTNLIKDKSASLGAR